MTTAAQMMEKLNRVDVLLSAQSAMEDTANDATRVQRDQLWQGLDRFDKRITNSITGSDQYAPKTVQIKISKGQPTDRITLKDTGSYYAGIKMDVQGEKFDIYSLDEKAEMLDVLYTPLGLGLNARIEWVRSLRPVFVRYIKQYLQ